MHRDKLATSIDGTDDNSITIPGAHAKFATYVKGATIRLPNVKILKVALPLHYIFSIFVISAIWQPNQHILQVVGVLKAKLQLLQRASLRLTFDSE